MKESWRNVPQVVNKTQIFHTRCGKKWNKTIQKRQKNYRISTYNIDKLKSGKFSVVKSNIGGELNSFLS